jgi:hypothetical protein
LINQIKIVDDSEYSKMHVRLEITHTTEIDAWIKERHYLKSVPCGARIRMVFKNRNHEIIGGMMWCRPSARKIEQWKILDLARMCFVDETPHCIESHCLSLARKHIRKHFPDVKGLIAYSSTGEGHEGIIYEADGWFQLGRSIVKSASWETRPGRTDRDLSDKIRWVRSP